MIIEQNNTFYIPICNSCKHYKNDLVCEAFPVIPDEIIDGENNHLKPLLEQNNNIVYEKNISKALVELLKAFVESEHPRDADGKFTDDAESDNEFNDKPDDDDLEESDEDLDQDLDFEDDNIQNVDSWNIGNVTVYSDGGIHKEEAIDYVKALGLDDDFDGEVKIGYGPDKSHRVSAEGEGIKMVRVFNTGEVYNEYFRINRDSKYKGTGTEIFTRQVEELERQGYKKMTTFAAGNGKENKRGGKGGYNGYYTWARLGYTPTDEGDILDIGKILTKYNKENSTDYKTLNEFVATTKGKEYWEENGITWHGEFDLTPDSENRRNLKAYIDAKTILKTDKLMTNKKILLGFLKVFVESEHPRDEDGKFTDGKPGTEDKKNWDIRNIRVSSNADLSKEQAEKYIKGLGLDKDFEGEVTVFNIKSPTDKSLDSYILEVEGSGIKLNRRYYSDLSRVENKEFNIANNSKYKGQGAEIFTRQVEELEKQGYKKMLTTAVGGKGGKKGYNGYYTWARLGYTPLNKNKASGPFGATSNDTFNIGKIISTYNKNSGTDYKNITELVATKNGKEYWKKNGIPWDGEFNLKAGSENRINLNNYNNAKGK